MLCFFLFFCFRTHTDHKWSKIQPKVTFPIETCDTIREKIKNPNSDNWWMNPNGDKDYFIKCIGGTSSKITLNGPGISKVRTNVINKLPNGLIYIRNADLDCTMTEIYSSGALSDTVQLIHIQGPGIHSITGTIFSFCGINPYWYINDNNKLPDNWDPSLIYIESDSNSINNFNQVSFKHPKTGSKQVWELCPTRPIRIEGDCSLSFTGRNNEDFYNSSCYSKGSFFWLGTKRDVFINNCNFQECISTINQCHAIWITEESEGNVTIDNCNFLDCGKNSHGYVIQAEVSGLIFINNKITFSSSNCSGCIKCNQKGEYIFRNNYFSNAEESSDMYQGVAIDYKGSDNGHTKSENLVFDGNTFDNIKGNNEGRCLSAEIREGKFTVLENNYIQNCPAGKFFVKIMQRSEIFEFHLNGWKFINNTVNDDYGGGAGIWIENAYVPGTDTHTVPFNLTLNSCEFENNYCNKKGGAFQIGSNDNNVNRDKFVALIEVNIINCIFTNNTAIEGGGAIAIQTNYPLTITGCQFINNKSPVSGGSIYIKTEIIDPSGENKQMETAIITNCIFRGNSGREAHCIYIVDAPKTTIEISNCHFYNNYDKNYNSGSCILSNAFQLTVTDCHFLNNDLEHSCGGINVTSASIFEVTKTEFHHCTSGSISNSYGGGIGYAAVNGDQLRTENIKISDCLFDGNGGTNGVAIGIKPRSSYPEISKIRIKNHHLTNWIFFIFFQFETEGDFELNDVTFDNNSYDSEHGQEFGGGTGLWIAESEDINYMNAFNLVFNKCTFTNNYSPENGGAISYGGSPRLESIELTFNSCHFIKNKCHHYFGGACRFETSKPVNLIDCTFDNNVAERKSETGGSGGGAIFFGSSVTSCLINGCNFRNCFAYRGSFIFTNGAMKDMNISKCTFSDLDENQDNSVYIEVDSQITRFIFDSNTFDGLHCDGPDGGAGLHIFNGADCVISNCKFNNCASVNDESGVIRINETINTNSFLIFDLCDFINDQGNGNSGERAIFIAYESLVKFNSCSFLGYDKGNIDGVILYSESKSSTVFFNCSFSNIIGKSVMKMENAESADVFDCQFTSCDVESSLIDAEKAVNFTVSNNLFSNNKEMIRFGDLVKIGLINNNTFQQCSTKHENGGALYINGNELVIEIKDNIFTKCSATNGLAIYITNLVSSVDIHDCIFTDNNKTDSFSYTIHSMANSLRFIDSIIQYEEDNLHGCGIKIDASCSADIYNIVFKNIHRPSAIYYKDIEKENDKITTIYNCSFSGFRPKGSFSSESFYSAFRFGTNTNVEFFNNTIKGHFNSGAGWPNLFIGLIEHRIENCTFISNKVDAQNGAGGAGLDFLFDPVISNCYFENNQAVLKSNSIGGTGGAIRFAKNARIEIDECLFVNNRADCEGGALSIECKSAYIHDSTFINNYAAQQSFGNSTSNNRMGGAIYFNSNNYNEKYTLTGCIFRQNTADQNGHALYICGFTTIVYVYDLCHFEDNSRLNGGSQIFVNENAHLDFCNSTVCLKNITSKSRGIEVLSGELVAHNTTFTNIEASKQGTKIEGNAILVSRGDNIVTIEDNLFKDCYINDQSSFAVTFDGKELNFYRNTFDFSPYKGSGCLRIYTTGKVNVENNIFQNANTPKDSHGIFIYEEKHRTTEEYHTIIKFNTFQYCTSLQTACFQFKWISQDYEFIDNNFLHNDLINYLGEFDFMGKKINGTFYFGRNHFINNTGRSFYSGGCGLWFQNKIGNANLIEYHFTIVFDGCNFIGNHAVENATDARRGYTNGNGGAIQLGWTESMSNIDVEFRNSTFINNVADRQGGALSIQIIGYTIIENCTFEGNLAGQSSLDPDQVLGGAIYVCPDFDYAGGHYSTNGGNWLYSENITIIGCKFTNNKAENANAFFFEISEHTDFFVIDCDFIDNYNTENPSFAIVCESRELVFEQSKIIYNDINKASAAIRTTSLVTITNSLFIKNSLNDKDFAESLLIETDANEIVISNSVFEDCGKDGKDFYTVKINTQIANIHNCVFNFTSNQESKSCCPVFIKEYCDTIFIENRITNSNCNGAFQYNPDNGDIRNENVLIEKCIFEKCQGKNSRALYVKLSTENITFKNNTIQDCPLSGLSKSGGYLFVFVISQTPITEFIIDKIIFRNLKTDSDFGGGCGAWIQHNKKYTLLFKDCIFENNYAKNNKVVRNCPNGKGGALQYGWTESISNVDLNIEGCQFIKNNADQEGGALCLMIQGLITISECKFVDNKAGNNFNGGAISIIPEFGYTHSTSTDCILIDECIFSGNNATDANAIFVDKAPKTDLVITNNCKFIDNTDKLSNHATVMCETRKLEVDDSLFDFSSLSKSCNAITTNSSTVVLEGTQFYRCLVPRNIQGSCLFIKESTKTANIISCQFIDNGNNNFGSVIYTEASSFSFSYSEISFSKLDVSDRGIYIPYVCNFYIGNSNFQRCKVLQNNNGASFFYEGIRRTSHNENIILENVHFNNNSCNYASCFYMKPSTVPKLKNLTVENHQTGNFVIVIIFQVKVREDILVEKCTFDNNLRNLSSERIPDCGGSGLWIACANKSNGYLESYRLMFHQCNFQNNNNNYCGGAFSYGYSPTLRYIFLDFNECTFTNNTCEGQIGGALSFNGQVPVTISKSYFKNNKCNSDNYRGHCIYIHQRCKATITDCTFLDNGIYNHSGGHEDSTSGHSIIQCSGTQLDVNNCLFNFTDANSPNSRFIDIDYYSVVNLKFTTFANCNAGDLWGGAIHLNKVISSIIDEQITIDSCIFDNVKAANGCAALLNTTGVPNLNNLTFKNTNDGVYIFAVFFVAFRDTCTVENTIFENCTAANEDGGGSAIWIANQEQISHGRPFELIFSNCTWRNNQATKRGGAIHYGNSKTLKGVQMTFEKCHFEGNHAKEEGGAVSLVTRSPITFSDCIFKNNIVDNLNSKGGSISINSKTPLVSIAGCSFNNETSSDGNAIFIHQIVQACIISGCTFKNCGKKGSVIVSETIELMLLNTEISFDRRLHQSSRALEIRTISVTTISMSTFRNCHSTDVGGAIYLNNTLMSEEQEDFTLENSTFDACESDLDGCSFYLNVSSSPVLRQIMFMNHRYDKNVSVVINNFEFQNLYTVESCTFYNNLFQNTNEQDGGGSGIFIANGIRSIYQSSYKISFIGCSWLSNNAAYGGAFSSGKNIYHHDTEVSFERCTFNENIATNYKGGALYLSTTQPIYFHECNFNNNKCFNSESSKEMTGGAIYIVESESVTISRSVFIGNYATDGHAVFIEDIKIVEVSECTFTSNNNDRKGSQISSKSEQLIFKDTTVEFNERKPQSRGIHIYRHCMTTFMNCQFMNCNITENGGAILITNDSPEINRTESLILSDCIFNKCDSLNGAVIQGTITCNPTIQRCTVSNCNGGHYIISLFFNTVQQFVSVDDCTFIGNYFKGTSTSDSGGIGLWIAHEKGMSVDKLTITFNRCFFISNRAAKNGGAFAYGESPTLKNISLSFSRCVFNGNTCDGGNGGALFISVNQQVTITDCDFSENKCNGANTKGSAVFISSPSEIVAIRDSHFNGGQAIDGAVYSTSSTNNLVITGSMFNNCGSSKSGSSICSSSKKFTFQSSTISFDIDNDQTKSRGIQITSKSNVILSDSHFYNCRGSSEGGSIKIDMSNGETKESLLIRSCIFENSNSLNGCAMFVKMNVEPTLEKITIRNCTSGNYVITFIFTSFVESVTLKEGIFEFNEFKNNAYPPIPDGGGSGIWIANEGLKYDDKLKTLYFENCLWFRNQVQESSSLKYGGGFAYGTSTTTKNTEINFDQCRFIQNKAKEKGGALYLCTNGQVSIIDCLFDGNEAQEGSNIYLETKSNVTIEYTQITRGKGGNQKGAVFINSNEILYMKNVTFSDNYNDLKPNCLYLHNEGQATIENCNFDMTRNSSNMYAIRLYGEASSASINFIMNCFTHKGDNSGSPVYIHSSHKGQINFHSGNCFDLSQKDSLLNDSGGLISIGSGVFNCNSCGSVYIPTLAPDSTPSQSPGPTREPGTETASTTTPSSTISISSSSTPGIDSSDKKKKLSTKMIAMIAGISAAVVVLIVVIIILLWLFVFRKRSSNKEKDSDENASEMNDEKITDFNQMENGENDPIWSGTNEDNPLFNDNGEDKNDDQMINNDFEENWDVI